MFPVRRPKKRRKNCTSDASHFGNNEVEQMKRLGIFLSVTMLVSVALFSVALAVDAPAVPSKVTNFGKMPVVTFNHATHKQNLECKSCHHVQPSTNYKCSSAGCHAQQAAGKAPAIKDAAHKSGKGKCWSCHFPAASNPVKPFRCNQCHKK
jgi:hypothetical protein